MYLILKFIIKINKMPCIGLLVRHTCFRTKVQAYFNLFAIDVAILALPTAIVKPLF